MYHFHFLNDCFHYAFWIIFLVVALVFTIYILIYQLYTNLNFRETFTPMESCSLSLPCELSSHALHLTVLQTQLYIVIIITLYTSMSFEEDERASINL